MAGYGRASFPAVMDSAPVMAGEKGFGFFRPIMPEHRQKEAPKTIDRLKFNLYQLTRLERSILTLFGLKELGESEGVTVREEGQNRPWRRFFCRVR